MNTRRHIAAALAEGRNLLEPEARSLLAEYGLPVGSAQVATTPAEAVSLAEAMGYPVVLKIVSPEIIHKSEAGGVKVNLANAAEVEAAFDEIITGARRYHPAARILGVLVTPHVKAGLEVIVGMVRDPIFGPTIMFGLGGVFVEVLKDVTFRVAPLTPADALEMINEIKGRAMLKGIRRQAPRDIQAIAAILLKVSHLAVSEPSIREIDLNPVFSFEEGAQIVDARILLG